MKIAVIGTGITQFGELWDQGLNDLLAKAQLAALDNAGIRANKIDAIFTGNMCAGLISNQLNLGGMAAEILHTHVPSTVVEGACASGGLALRAGIQAIESGRAKIVLVNGVEKLTDISNDQITHAMMLAGSEEWEHTNGITFPALAGMTARLYMHEYGLTREQLAAVSVMSHANALTNPIAHFRKAITIEDVINAPMVADPLTMLDCSPVSDGAASVVLCHPDVAQKICGNPVYIIGSGQGSDTLCIHKRENLLEWKATKAAAAMAFDQAGISRDDIDVMEVHDGFSIVEILALEDLGFCKKGDGGRFFEETIRTSRYISLRETLEANGEENMSNSINKKNPFVSSDPSKLEERSRIVSRDTNGNNDGGLLINPSGGLKAKGHPVGATGVAQVVEIVQQLRTKKMRYGLTHNAGGVGTTVTVHILGK